MPPRQRIARRPPQALPSLAPPPPPGAPGATAGRAPRAGLTTLTSRGTAGRAPRVGFTTLTSRGTPVGHHASGSPPWSEDHPTLASHRRGQGCTAGTAITSTTRSTRGHHRQGAACRGSPPWSAAAQGCTAGAATTGVAPLPRSPPHLASRRGRAVPQASLPAQPPQALPSPAPPPPPGAPGATTGRAPHPGIATLVSSSAGLHRRRCHHPGHRR